MHTHRMGLNPFLTFYIDAMLNFDGDVDANGNANVKCEHTIRTGRQRSKKKNADAEVTCE